MFERELDAFGESFEMSGEFVIALPDDANAECTALGFFWKADMPEILVFLEGKPEEITKILKIVKDKNAEIKGKEKAGLLLKMKDKLLKKVKVWFETEKQADFSRVLVQGSRAAEVFDFENYEVVSTASE